jgi:hypothetical protein
MTDMRITPATFATQLARLNAEADAILLQATEKQAAAKAEQRETDKFTAPYTTESAGYAYTFTPPVFDDEEDTLPTEMLYGKPWMEATLADFGIDTTPRLRRTIALDEPDSTEALDATLDYLGFHVA